MHTSSIMSSQKCINNIFLSVFFQRFVINKIKNEITIGDDLSALTFHTNGTQLGKKKVQNKLKTLTLE